MKEAKQQAIKFADELFKDWDLPKICRADIQGKLRKAIEMCFIEGAKWHCENSKLMIKDDENS